MELSSALPRDYWTHLPHHVAEGSLWLRIAFIALSVFASATVVLASGEAPPVKAAAWALASAAATYFAFRRCCMLMGREEAAIDAQTQRARA